MYVFILDFMSGSVFWHKLPETENGDSVEEYLSSVLNIDTSNAQWMVTETREITEISDGRFAVDMQDDINRIDYNISCLDERIEELLELKLKNEI